MWMLNGTRHWVKTALLGLCLTLLMGAALPAAASATYPWANQAAMQNEEESALRDTFIVRPASGATISRQRFRSQPYRGFYKSFGFDRNFFTWAPKVSVGDGYVVGRRWTACKGTQVPVSGGPSHCAASAVKLGAEAKFVRESVTGGKLTGFKWGNAFVSNICGNWSPTNASKKAPPIPKIRGVKYEDLNADGSRDPGEPGLGGWTMRLLYNGSQVTTTTTSASGAYSFNLDAEALPIGKGTYRVKEVLKPGWHQSEAPGSIAIGYGIGDEVFGGNDFGNWEPATIAGSKFDDSNVDGKWGASEFGLPDWTIGLSNGDETLTAADGSYSFSVRPGTYTVGETVQGGWRQSAPGLPGTYEYTVVSGQVVTDVDFGNVCLGTIEVDPIDDSTGESLTDVEIRIEEVSVPGILENEPPLPRTTTGTPTFGELLPGAYRVVAFLPEGVFTTDPDAAIVEERFAIVKEIVVNECETTNVPIHTFTESTPGKITGGIRLALPGGFATSGFEFMTRKGQPRGTLQYNDHVSGLNLHTKTIEAIYVDGEVAWVWGKVEVEGAQRRFRLRLVDAGEPGFSDRYELTLENGYDAGQGGTIDKGNVQLH